MEIELLRAFCILAESQNYRLASERLFLTQPAITKKIQRLESKVGAPLFERGRHGACLTAAGQSLLPEAQRLLRQFDQFDTLSQRVSSGLYGSLKIGFGVSTYHEAPRFVAAFKQRYPDVNIVLNDIPSQTQLDQLQSGELDVSFNRIPSDSQFKTLPLFDDQLVVAIHRDEDIDEQELWHSLVRHNYLKLATNRGPGLSRQIECYLAANQLELTIAQEADDILTLLALVSARLGFTIVPQSAQAISNPYVRFIPLKGDYAQWPIGLVCLPHSPNALLDNFVELVTELNSRGGTPDTLSKS
ncbi:LysR family transcriptional regulator [Vibrio tubiashii]|uniref:LysR family transcriptional regulator n=1 Tax=Vibrio tubiashii TaxID=29498 RepID=UPI001EFD4918|nr:LysR family transcriptional regulator [Vibrio tubiashii]MCG9581335.1 LysR family transcriptional regulator [Vibrio tubiashii]MCG9614926.1 LysR family transcriptional regulator [Vibrio tubiashii]MCG9690142.1 LysR family transcriptional regulator [Vibrio tubiashii]